MIVNSGNANVFAGQKSRDAVIETATHAAAIFGGAPEAVFLASTGVIGEPLEALKLTKKFPGMKAALHEDGWEDAARAIMTTDTFPKLASAQCEVDGVTVTLSGMAKGSGMIAPDMATMLAFAATDANIGQAALQTLLAEGAESASTRLP